MSNKCALLVGINYIGTTNQLNGCINDINTMKDLLGSKFKYDKFIVLTDETAQKPTKHNILNALNDVINSSMNYNEVLFHYSGHGTSTIDKNNDESDGYDEAIVPLDYSQSGLILDDDLYAIIKNVKCNMKIILDSCHSGTCIDLPYVNSYDSQGNLALKTTEKNTNCNTTYDIFMISGCRDNQLSIDIYEKDKKKFCGALTNSLANNLLSGDDISISNLMSMLNKTLKRYSQNPSFSSNKIINMNTPFISNFKPAPPVQSPAQPPARPSTQQTIIKPNRIIHVCSKKK